MSKNSIIVALVAALALAATACGITGSGDMVTEERDVGDFDRIDVSAGIDVILTVESGSEPSVTVTYDDNIIDDVITEVRGTTLVIQYRNNFTFVGGLGSDRVVEVVTDSLEDIELSGGSSVVASGQIDAYTLEASGGANADLRDLEADEVDVDASGGANVDLYASDMVTGDASGGANVTVYGDPSDVRVDTSGGADVRIR